MDENYPKPEQIKNPDLTRLRKELDDYLEFKDCSHRDCDCEHYLYETLMETFYGDNVFTYINEKFD